MIKVADNLRRVILNTQEFLLKEFLSIKNSFRRREHGMTKLKKNSAT